MRRFCVFVILVFCKHQNIVVIKIAIWKKFWNDLNVTLTIRNTKYSFDLCYFVMFLMLFCVFLWRMYEAAPHQKVVWLDITVQKFLRMHVFDTLEHLEKKTSQKINNHTRNLLSKTVKTWTKHLTNLALDLKKYKHEKSSHCENGPKLFKKFKIQFKNL